MFLNLDSNRAHDERKNTIQPTIRISRFQWLYGEHLAFSPNKLVGPPMKFYNISVENSEHVLEVRLCLEGSR